jgi:putative ABC transport system permease protein
MPLSRLSLRELQNRPARTLLTILSIVIGAGAIVATALSSKSARLAQVAMVQAVTGRTSLEVQSVGGSSFDAKQVAFLTDTDGLEVISPAIRRFATMTVTEPKSPESALTESTPPQPNKSSAKIEPRKFRVQLLGVDLEQDQLVRNTEIIRSADRGESSNIDSGATDADAAETAKEQEVFVDEGFAKAAKLEFGQQVRLLTKGGNQTARIGGWIRSKDASSALQSAVVVAPLRVVQRWTRSPGKLDLVQLVARDEKQLEALETTIAKQLPEGVSVRRPSMRSELASESTYAIQRGLLIATIFSLIMAAFIIFNTFQMNIGERRRQLGILRAIGTTRKQLLWMILREGFLLGVIGSAIGCACGYFGASVLNRSTSALLQIDIPQAPFDVLPMILAMVCGILVSVLGAGIPAMMASLASPSDAMKVVAESDKNAPYWKWFQGGIVLIIVGAFIQTIATLEIINVQLGTPGIVLVILGVILLLPASLDSLTMLAAAPLMLWFPTETRLARRQIMRHPGRSAMTIGIMLVAMAMGLGMASTIFDNIRDVQSWYQRTIVGDFFIRAAMPDMSSGHAADMPDGFVQRVEEVAGVKLVDTLRFVSARAGDSSVIVVVRKFNSKTQDFFDLVRGTEAEAMQGIHEGRVVLGSVLSERMQLGPGDSIELETNQGKTKLEIAGVTNEYLAGGLTLYMEAEQAKKLLNVDGTDAVIIQVEPGKRGQVADSLKALADSEGLMFQSFSDLANIIEGMINGVVGGLWAVLALGALIAAFGLINTLAMNILEQTREIGMLRVIAMTRSQIRKMILAQAWIMSLIGIIPGVVLGVGIASVINISTMVVTGHAVRFQLYPWMMFAAILCEIVVVTLAALLPAERAARLNLASALQYE